MDSQSTYFPTIWESATFHWYLVAGKALFLFSWVGKFTVLIQLFHPVILIIVFSLVTVECPYLSTHILLLLTGLQLVRPLFSYIHFEISNLEKNHPPFGKCYFSKKGMEIVEKAP